MKGTLATKEWVQSLIKKIKERGYFFEVSKLRYLFTSGTFYNSSAKEKFANFNDIKTLYTVPDGVVKSDMTIIIKRETGSISGSTYPRVQVIVNSTVVAGDTVDTIQGTSYTYPLNNLVAGDKISVKLSTTGNPNSPNAVFTFNLTGTHITFGYEV